MEIENTKKRKQEEPRADEESPDKTPWQQTQHTPNSIKNTTMFKK